MSKEDIAGTIGDLIYIRKKESEANPFIKKKK